MESEKTVERGVQMVKTLLDSIEYGQERTFFSACDIGRRLNQTRMEGGSVEIEALFIDDGNECIVKNSCVDCHIGRGILSEAVTDALGGDTQLHHVEHLVSEYGQYGESRLLPLSCPIGTMLANLEQTYASFGFKNPLFMEVAQQNNCKDTGTCLQCPLGKDQFADILLRMCDGGMEAVKDVAWSNKYPYLY
jgi:hypothetical protein